jgi:hypothetical protein
MREAINAEAKLFDGDVEVVNPDARSVDEEPPVSVVGDGLDTDDEDSHYSVDAQVTEQPDNAGQTLASDTTVDIPDTQDVPGTTSQQRKQNKKKKKKNQKDKKGSLSVPLVKSQESSPRDFAQLGGLCSHTSKSIDNH